jgi:phage FluMu protein Com
MEVRYEHQDKILIKCPHCKKTHVFHYTGEGTVEVEPPDREEDG